MCALYVALQFVMADFYPHVMFLSPWYPNRYDAMMGLFVRKHALAVSRYVRVTVLYLHEDGHACKTELLDQTVETIREISVYYPKSEFFPRLAYNKAFAEGWEYVVKQCGMPDLTHVSVFGKQAWSAYRLYRKYGIPYVVTEHWTGYLQSNMRYKGLLRKKITELVARNARCIMPVSENLAMNMQCVGLKGNYRVVYNVVDDFFYNPVAASSADANIVRLLHVSCFDDKAKNVSGLLRAVERLRHRRTDFLLTLVGTGMDFAMCRDLARQLGIDDICTFTGELQPREVADLMRRHDVFVLNSNYENAPVVISEALAVGLPVVSTNVGGISEMVSLNEGILVRPNDTDALVEALDTMCSTYVQYDKAAIRNRGLQYSFDIVGKEIYNIYKVSVSDSR